MGKHTVEISIFVLLVFCSICWCEGNDDTSSFQVPKQVKGLLSIAENCFSRKNWDRAIKYYKQLMDRYSEYPFIKTRLHDIKLKMLFAEFSRDFKLSPELLKRLFAGDVLNYIPEANVIEIQYTCKDPKELADFHFAQLDPNGMKVKQKDGDITYKGMNKYSSFFSLLIPFKAPWKVEMVLQEENRRDVVPTLSASRGGYYLCFADLNGEYGYRFGIDINFHDGRLSARHGIVKYHPGGFNKWEFINTDFSPRLVPFQEMKVTVLFKRSGELYVILNGDVILKAVDDSFKKGYFHFGPGNVFFKSIKVMGKLYEKEYETLLNEIKEEAWAERLEDFKKTNGIIPPERFFEFTELNAYDVLRLIDFDPKQQQHPEEEADSEAEETTEVVKNEVVQGEDQKALNTSETGRKGVNAEKGDKGNELENIDSWGIPADEDDGFENALQTDEAEKEPEQEKPDNESQGQEELLKQEEGNPLLGNYEAGLKLRKEGKFREALEKFNEVLRYNKNSIPALYERSFCYYMLEEDNKSLNNIQIINGFYHYYDALSFLKIRISYNKNDYKTGFEAANAISRESGYYPYSRLLVGWFFYLNGELEQSEQNLEEAVRLDGSLSGVAAWYRDRIKAFKNGPRWVKHYTAEGKLFRIHTGVSKSSARQISRIIHSIYSECSHTFRFLKKKRSFDKELIKIDVYSFSTMKGLKNYLERIIIGIDRFQKKTNIVYDANYDRVFFFNPLLEESFKEAVANIAVMTFLRDLSYEVPPWLKHGLSFYYENSRIEDVDKGMFNLSGSNHTTILFSENKKRDLMKYYLHLTKKYNFPLTYERRKKEITINTVLPARTEIETGGAFNGTRILLGLTPDEFTSNLEDNKIEAGLLVYFLLKYRKGFYGNFIPQYVTGTLKEISPEEILNKYFPPKYLDKILKIKDHYLLNLWQNDICRDRYIPLDVLFGKDFAETLN